MRQYKKIITKSLQKSLLFGENLSFDLRDSFPIVTLYNVRFKTIKHELLWLLEGKTNVRDLQKYGTTHLSALAEEDGSLGPHEGAQMRSWIGEEGKIFDQVSDVQEKLRKNPSRKDIIISTWAVHELGRMVFKPKHCMFHFTVEDNKLSCHGYVREDEIVFGLPRTICIYALFTQMLAQTCNLSLGNLFLSFGVLSNAHIDLSKIILTRDNGGPAEIGLNKNVKDIFQFKSEDIFWAKKYQPRGYI